MTNFNFDEWALLYKEDAEEFERRRTLLLQEVIASAPVHIRNELRVIQLECDVIHNMQDTMVATKAMSDMMLSKLSQLESQLKRLKVFIE